MFVTHYILLLPKEDPSVEFCLLWDYSEFEIGHTFIEYYIVDAPFVKWTLFATPLKDRQSQMSSNLLRQRDTMLFIEGLLLRYYTIFPSFVVVYRPGKGVLCSCQSNKKAQVPKKALESDIFCKRMAMDVPSPPLRDVPTFNVSCNDNDETVLGHFDVATTTIHILIKSKLRHCF